MNYNYWVDRQCVFVIIMAIVKDW